MASKARLPCPNAAAAPHKPGLILLLALWGLCCAPGVVLAQDAPPAAPKDSEPQNEDKLDYVDVSMLTSAFEAFEAGDYATAEALFLGAVERTPSNYAYASLGLSIFLQGRCAGAGVAYDLAETAPPVETPTQAEVSERLTLYRSKLAESCIPTPVSCSPDSGVRIELDGKNTMACPPSGKLWLKEGTHSIVVSYAGLSEQAQVVAGQSEALFFEFPEIEPEPPEVIVESFPWEATGLVTMGVGTAALVAAVVVDQLVAVPSYDAAQEAEASNDAQAFVNQTSSFKTGRRAVLGLTISGGVLMGVGALMWALSPEASAAAEEPVDGGNASLWWVPDGAGVSWSQSW